MNDAPVRAPVIVVAVLVLAGLLAGCGSSGEQRDAAQAFLSAWGRGDVAGAAGATDDPTAARAALTRTGDELGLGAGQLRVGDADGGTVAYAANWPVSPRRGATTAGSPSRRAQTGRGACTGNRRTSTRR